MAAIREGSVHLGYDTRFIFAEVNGDIVKWIQEPDGTQVCYNIRYDIWIISNYFKYIMALLINVCLQNGSFWHQEIHIKGPSEVNYSA